MVSVASMATPANGNVTAVVKNKVHVFGIINFVPLIYYEKSATRNIFLRKKKISEKKFTESE